jgi:hypothetical protein
MYPLKKAKKITVRFFLNRMLKPITKEKGKELYPLYIQVTYNRKNMQLRSKYGEYYHDLKEAPSGLLEFEERVLRRIITREASHLEDSYNLKGLRRNYEIYSLSIHQAIEDYLKPKLRAAIRKINSPLTHVLDFDSDRATVPLLQAAAQKLFPDFERRLGTRLRQELAIYEQFLRLYKPPFLNYSFPMIIDWSEGGFKEELNRKVQLANKNSSEIFQQLSELIRQAVSQKFMVLDD